jgi:hypothetical protein
MGRTGSSNKKRRQRHPVVPQELIQMQQHDGKRSEVEHENTSCPQQDLARIRIQAQRKAALRVSMEDDDMFTMSRWSVETLEHENTSYPQQDLARIRIQAQRKAALRVSMENDDMFTMFQWSEKAMGRNESSIDSERAKYQQMLRRDSMKKQTPISVKDIFGEEELKKEKLRLSLLDRGLSSPFGYNTQKMERQGSVYHFFGLNFRRPSP